MSQQLQFDQLPDDSHTVAQQQPSQQQQPLEFDQLQDDNAKYETPVEQLKTGLEGAASAATFGLSTGIEKHLFGAKDEDINARRETNPGSYMAGQVAGLGASALLAPELGATKLLGAAGEGAAGLMGLAAPTSTVAKVGSAAVKAGIENMLVAGGDEVSRMLSSDPNQSVQTAVANIGLSGIIGAGVGGIGGGVKELWNATAGNKLQQLLGAIQNHANGVEGGTELDKLINSSGLAVPDEVKPFLANDPQISQALNVLRESDTKAGRAVKQGVQGLRESVSGALADTLGDSGGEPLSQYEMGNALKQSLSKHLEDMYTPIKESYGNLKGEFGGVEVSPDMKAQIAERISQMASENRYNLFEDTPQNRVIKSIMGGVPNISNISDLALGATRINDMTNNPELWSVGKQLRKIFRESESDAIEMHLGENAPEKLDAFKTARTEYGKLMGMIEELNDRVRAGKYAGPESFITALNDMQPEDLVRRLTDRKDAELLSMLKSQFPETAEQVRQSHLSSLLEDAAKRAKGDEEFNPTTLLKRLKETSPELKQFLFDNGQLQRLDAIDKVFTAIPDRANTSGTAGVLEKLTRHVPGTALGVAAAVTGHNPAAALLLGHLAPLVTREAPDAIKLSLLKFLAHPGAVDANGFATMTKYIGAVQRGEALTAKAVSALFNAGRQVLPEHLIPSKKDTDKLDKRLQALAANPNDLLNIGEHTSPYLPEHAGPASETAMRAVNYLNSLRPGAEPNAPLDPEMAHNPIQQERYEQALRLAEQPLLLVKHANDGTITQEDIQDMQQLYPAFHANVVSKVNQELAELKAKGKTLPADKVFGLSILTGQPLISTLSPQSIMAAQPLPPAMPAMGAGGGRGHRSGTSKMVKLTGQGSLDASVGNSLQMRRMGHSLK